MPQYRSETARFPDDDAEQRRLLRSLMNVRPPLPLDADFLHVQDELLSAETAEKGVVQPQDLESAGNPRIFLWQGDITRLGADAVVNAANSALLGCFIPCHGCIDNAIHSAAGLQLRDECARLMRVQGYEEPVGRARITGAYNLPARFVIHTVGPAAAGSVGRRERQELRSCYESCLVLAAEHGLKSIAFCCISTGEFHFPNEEAAGIAVTAVQDYLKREQNGIKVIFNVYKDIDCRIYRKLLPADCVYDERNL